MWADELPPTAGLPLRLGDLLPRRTRLEDRLHALYDLPDPLLTCSGTAAFLLSLRALQRLAPRRDEVVVPAYTCPLVALAVRAAGLQLRLCDLREGHFDMDTAALRAVCGPRTLAVVPTHLGGRLTDVASASAVAHACGAWVIEDAAQALGARLGGTSAGLQGDIGFFSLAVGKGLSLYEGGVLVSADPELRALLAREAAQVPWRLLWELRRSLELLGMTLLYRPMALRLAYGLPLRRALRRGDPEAAIGDRFDAQIPLHRLGPWRRAVGANAAIRLADFQVAARARALEWRSELTALPGLEVFGDRPGERGTWPVLWLRLPDRQCRDAVLDALWTQGVGASRMFIHALPDYAYLRDCVPDTSVPQARALAECTLTLGNSAWLDAPRRARIRQVLADVLSHRV
ncbi:DegT/DnrJ/EryC1/StrS family aminotransferase [Xanthomonas maliensis]|uniref:DegT/DnrJ/EryC1/StrS family aminotransferase n=1 Tax=Xanthomonas maliensis TaxID=1321368 RepID=UPI0003B6E18E|nr:DegT/DnrJ/EryC1/StrS family aminotransferase [Xanthomonas maliensis]KAB7770557.1 nucleotide sugar aminotransferase [Xanthomonas maliensis]